jgi:membrane protease YdiL (CAAX protease family)
MKKNYNDKFHFKTKGWIWGSIWPSLLYLGLSIIIGIIGGIIAAIVSHNNGTPVMEIALSGKFNLIMTIIVQILTIAVVLPFYLYNRKHYYPKPKQKPSIKIVIYSIFFIFLVGIPSDYLLSFIKEHFISNETGLDLVNNIISDAPIVISLISVVILAPITEELMIRGLTLNKLLSKKSVLFSVLASGIIFGVIHMNILQGIFAAIAGFALAYVFIKTKSIIPCIICHFANNLLALIEINMTDKQILIFSIVLMIISIVPTYLLIKEKEIEYE